ncbi:MAG: hypothetical protein E7379_03180 [Clostridiales bacterium]|nr:hypothetical protein [Clostridiales bacterium]
MLIIVEHTLAISFLSCLLSLELSSKVLKQKARFKFFSAFLGSIVSVIYPIFQLSNILKILLLIFCVNLIVLISFKYYNFLLFLRNIALVLLATCVFGGIMEGIKNLIGEFSLFVASLILLVSYFCIKYLLHSIDRSNKINQFTFEIKIKDGEKVICEQGYLDSGNVMKDSVTNKPIILVTFDVFHKLYENVNYVSALTKQYNFKDFKLGHFVSIKGIGSGNKILVFSVDELWIGENKLFKDAMLGLSFSGFEKSFGKNVLLNYEMI